MRSTVITADLTRALVEAVGPEHVLQSASDLAAYAADALGEPGSPEAVVRPATTAEVSAAVRACQAHRMPVVVRGAGTGYTGGAVATRGGVVLSVERLSRILDIDTDNLLAVVQPAVITGDLQRAVEAKGLFYPPDPASLDRCSIGGNVAECAGGPRAFKYGTTKHYVLALEAVLADGTIIRTGSKAVKNVVGYDLTHLLVGSEGTLAVITEITLRLVPMPSVRSTAVMAFPSIQAAVDAVTAIIGRRIVPSALEVIDAFSLDAAARYSGRALVPAGAAGALIVECDGVSREAIDAEMAAVESACLAAGAVQWSRADTPEARDRIWDLRRQISLALRATGLTKINHDVVVPRGRVPALYDAVHALAREYDLTMAAFGHAGDGNIHVNVMIARDDAAARARATAAEAALFRRVVALEGSISGEHGIGYTKAPYLPIEIAPDVIALMRRVKAAFDPDGLLNPGKLFP